MISLKLVVYVVSAAVCVAIPAPLIWLLVLMPAVLLVEPLSLNCIGEEKVRSQKQRWIVCINAISVGRARLGVCLVMNFHASSNLVVNA